MATENIQITVANEDVGKDNKSGDDKPTKRKITSSGNGGNQYKNGRPGGGKYQGNFKNHQFYDEVRFQCQFCTFKCRRFDEMSCHYREKHDYVVSKSSGDNSGGDAIHPVSKTNAPTRQSLIFSPSNYIFISNPGEYLLDINDEEIEGNLIYIPGFLQRKDADDYLYAFKKNLPWTQVDAFNKKQQKQMKEPRLSCYFGPNYEYGSVKWQDKTEFDPKVKELKEAVEKQTNEKFNSALGVLYRTGRDHMGWHSDDEPELGLHPTIASVSLGATRYFEFSRKGNVTKLVRLALKHGDLLVTKGCVQEKWKHWVPRDPDVAHCRVNITFRIVDPSKRPATSLNSATNTAASGAAKSSTTGAGDSASSS